MRKSIDPTLRALFLLPALLLALLTHLPAQAPQTGQGRLIAGINLFSQGKFHEAVLELRRAQAEARTNELRAEALFWIGLSGLSSGEYEEALRDMDALEKTDPKSRRIAELPYHRGRALYFLGRFDEAIVLLKGYADSITPTSAATLGPADISRKSSALYWTGESLYSLGQLDTAQSIFQSIIEEYPGSPKYEASLYRLALINQKKVEMELLDLLKWSHEESLKNMEDFQRKEAAYDQALNTYQRRINEMQASREGLENTRLQELEDQNNSYREQLESAENKIRDLESSLSETSQSLETARNSTSIERLKNLQLSAQELENTIQGNGK